MKLSLDKFINGSETHQQKMKFISFVHLDFFGQPRAPKKAFRHHLDENFRQINVQLSCTLDHLCEAHNTQQPSLKI